MRTDLDLFYGDFQSLARSILTQTLTQIYVALLHIAFIRFYRRFQLPPLCVFPHIPSVHSF